jgi:alkylresorcinol/alkylpyrone synthase
VDPTVLAVGRALPRHYASQEQLIGEFRRLWARRHFNLERLEELHRAVRVGGRHLALPIERYYELDTFGKANAAWIEAATDLGAEAVRSALERAGVGADEVNHFFFVTVTGISTPSIDARLVNRLGMRRDIKRTPMFGLGCVAGASGLARAADSLRAYPDQIAVVLAVELCSLTLQREDISVANIIASGLFGDGAAAVVLGPRGRPAIRATGQVFYRDTEDVMGWEIVDSGFKVVLSPRVPQVIREHIGRDIDAFLAAQGLARAGIRHWIAHTGGPKVLDAFQSALALPPEALALSWRSLAEVGNLSSASVLYVLGDFEDAGIAKPGEHGLLVAMGPGFCAEVVLLQW